MKLNAVHHIAIIVSSYGQSRAFYVDKLGFDIVRENYRPEKMDSFLERYSGLFRSIIGMFSLTGKGSGYVLCLFFH